MPVPTDARIAVNLASLERGTTGAITGEVALEYGGQFFPERGWNDFPVVVLTWWLEALTPLFRGKDGAAQCRFMDGPQLFTVRRRGETWALEARPLGSGPIDGPGVADSVVDAGQQLLAECGRRGWHSEDVDRLSAVLKTIALYRAT